MDAFINIVDTKRVHASGFSQGGAITWKMLCEASDLICSVSAIGMPPSGEHRSFHPALGFGNHAVQNPLAKNTCWTKTSFSVLGNGHCIYAKNRRPPHCYATHIRSRAACQKKCDPKRGCMAYEWGQRVHSTKYCQLILPKGGKCPHGFAYNPHGAGGRGVAKTWPCKGCTTGKMKNWKCHKANPAGPPKRRSAMLQMGRYDPFYMGPAKHSFANSVELVKTDYKMKGKGKKVHAGRGVKWTRYKARGVTFEAVQHTFISPPPGLGGHCMPTKGIKKVPQGNQVYCGASPSGAVSQYTWGDKTIAFFEANPCK